MDPLDDVPQQAGAEPVDCIRSVEPRYGSVEWWVRETGDRDLRDAGCSLAPDGSWCVVVPAMEFARGGIEFEYSRRVTAAILAVDGVRATEHEDREAWRVEGTPTGPALLEAVAVVIDEFGPRLTTG
jgi:hypothetical protein